MGSAKPNNDREVAKLSVENEMLKKKVEDLQAQINSGSSSSSDVFKPATSSVPADRETEELKLKISMLREENQKLSAINKERQSIES